MNIPGVKSGVVPVGPACEPSGPVNPAKVEVDGPTEDNSPAGVVGAASIVEYKPGAPEL